MTGTLLFILQRSILASGVGLARNALLFQTTMILLQAIVRSASDRKPHFGWPPGAVRLPHTVTDLTKGEQLAERALYLGGRHVTAEVIVDSCAVHPIGTGGAQRAQDVVGERITAEVTEDVARRGFAVVP